MHTLVVQVYALAGHAHAGTCTCISAINLVHGFVNMHAAQPSVWHFSALVVYSICYIKSLHSTYKKVITCTISQKLHSTCKIIVYNTFSDKNIYT